PLNRCELDLSVNGGLTFVFQKQLNQVCGDGTSEGHVTSRVASPSQPASSSERSSGFQMIVPVCSTPRGCNRLRLAVRVDADVVAHRAGLEPVERLDEWSWAFVGTRIPLAFRRRARLAPRSGHRYRNT